jgi:hypothetical protein
MLRSRPFAASIALLMSFVTSASSQPPQRLPHAMADSSARQIMAHLRSLGPERFQVEWLGDILRQRGKPQPLAKLDEVADSLTTEVIRQSRVRGSTSDSRVLDLIYPLNALVVAGMTAPGASGIPYSGTLDRLVRIHREAEPNNTVRSVVLHSYLCGEFERGLSALREVAVSEDRTAAYAMDQMVSTAMGAGSCGTPSPAQRQQVRAELRIIFDGRLAKSVEARSYLSAFAAREGWTRG